MWFGLLALELWITLEGCNKQPFQRIEAHPDWQYQLAQGSYSPSSEDQIHPLAVRRAAISDTHPDFIPGIHGWLM